MGVAINLDEMAAAFVQIGVSGGDWAEPLALAESAFAARGVILMNYALAAGHARRAEIAANPEFARAAVRAASVMRAFRAPEGLLRQALARRPIAAFMTSREGVRSI